jgi:hypothetical protein
MPSTRLSSVSRIRHAGRSLHPSRAGLPDILAFAEKFESGGCFRDGRRQQGLAGPRIELGTEREGLLQVLDENPDFGR